MRQLAFFGLNRQESTFEEMRYIASLLKVWMPDNNKPKEREKHWARLLEAVRPEVAKWKEALERNMFEPNIPPEILLFWSIYGEKQQGTEV
jgi:hypothetical protein